VLGHYVREQGVLDLPEAVRRMTSLSCDRFGFVDRGRIVDGQIADLVLFDPETIADTATYDNPQQEATGIDLVVVNGKVALRDGTHTGVGGGRLLHHLK
jgi:N-acyl-D-aspartate/D-glutamate deacylase